MRPAIVAVVVALCAAIGAYLCLSYIQPAPADSAAQTQLPPSPATTTAAAPQQAINPASTPSAVPATTSLPSATSAVSSETANHPGMMLYRNDEYGFEFWYPEMWETKENTYGNPGTKFNVVARPVDANGKHSFYEPLTVAVVTSDFAEKEFGDLTPKARPIMVDGKNGLRYEYAEDVSYTDIIIPLTPDESIIIGNDNDSHIANFERILTSFRFTK